MEKKTHLIFAFLLFLVFNFMLNYPLYYSVFAFLGAMVPDLDLSWKHRKIFHNIWFLLLIDYGGLASGLLAEKAAVAFSVGFLSHLASDSLTHRGIMPLWPIKKPRFSGIIRTGSLGEIGLMLGMLYVIFWLGGML